MCRSQDCVIARHPIFAGQNARIIHFAGFSPNHFDEIYQGLTLLRSNGTEAASIVFRSRSASWDEEFLSAARSRLFYFS